MIEHLVNYNNILYSCCFPHDLHWEHRIPTHAIIYVRSGKLVIEGKEHTDEIMPGNFVFLRRDCAVNVTKVPMGGEPYRGLSFTLPRRELKEYYGKISDSENLPRNLKAVNQVAYMLPKAVPLKSFFDSFLPFVDSGEEPSEEWLKLKAHEAIFILLNIDKRFYPILFDFNEAWKIDLLDFMENNFTEDMSLEEFATYTGRSLATFKRDFAKLSDQSPERWIIDHRLELAKKMLRDEGLLSKDVSSIVGFKNRSHFSQAFKRRYGYSPSEVGKL